MNSTFQTKIPKTTENKIFDCLSDYCNLFGMIERKMYVAIVFRKQSKKAMKKDYCRAYKITARQFNSIYSSIDGKIKALKELKAEEIKDKKKRIDNLETKIDKLCKGRLKTFETLSALKQTDEKHAKVLKKYRKIKFSIHQKKRKKAHLERRLKALLADQEKKVVRMCFGSKTLYKKQHELESNGYTNHKEWQNDWRSKRSNQAFFLGSSDESFGNQNCQYTKENNFHIKVPEALEEKYGQSMVIENIRFKYGQEFIDPLKECYIGKTRGGKDQKYYKGPMSHRIVKKEHGWYIYTSISLAFDAPKDNTHKGVLGVDFNVNFASVTETDRFGNPISTRNIKYEMYNKKSGQIDTRLSQLASELVKEAKRLDKNIILEDLEFKTAKLAMKDKSKKYSRMLSGFPYKKFQNTVLRKAEKEGVLVKLVNPAYTSVMGQVKYMKRYGLSSHASAALVIGRKGLGYDEKMTRRSLVGPLDGKLKHKTNKEMWKEVNQTLKKYTFKNRMYILYKTAV